MGEEGCVDHHSRGSPKVQVQLPPPEICHCPSTLLDDLRIEHDEGFNDVMGLESHLLPAADHSGVVHHQEG